MVRSSSSRRTATGRTNTLDDQTEQIDRWRLSQEVIKFNLMTQKMIIGLKILPLETDKTGKRIWMPPESAYWKRAGIRNIWIGFASLRLMFLILSVLWTIFGFGESRRVQSYELILDVFVIFDFSLLFHGYCTLIPFDLPSQTILANQIVSYLGKGKKQFF